MSTMFKDLPQINWLPDGKRLQMRHGPIDLIISAEGGDTKLACQQAAMAFDGLLSELVGELDILRIPVGGNGAEPTGVVARNMLQAASDLGEGQFTTPMIAVAGAVADHVLGAMTAGTNLQRAYVNNGGDIALYLADGQSFDVGVCADPVPGAIASTAHIKSSDNIGGIATSGWRGRSHSLGIADAVTVLANNAASADVAATLIANAVDITGHPSIKRVPANELSPDSDLGARPVTVDVGPLTLTDVETAMLNGREVAMKLLDQDLIRSVFITLKSEMLSLAGMGRDACPMACSIVNITRSGQSGLEVANA